MNISIDAFRSFVDGSIGARKTVNFGNKEKTTLSTERFTPDRPLASRQVVQMEAAQDNNFVRIQLLRAVGDALGSVDNGYFNQVREQLFGSKGSGAVDLKIASKPLTVRDVRQVLVGLDARLAAQATQADFAQEIDRTFATCSARSAFDDAPLPTSARFREMVNLVLLPAAEAELAAHPDTSLAKLTGPNSAFDIIRQLCASRNSAGVMRILIKAAELPPTARTAYLRAYQMLNGSMQLGLDSHLHRVASELAALKEKDFTPAKVFSLAFPDTAWPKGISKRATELTTAERNQLVQAWTGGIPERLLQELSLAPVSEHSMLNARQSACTLMFDAGMTRADVERVLADPHAFTPEMIPSVSWCVGAQQEFHGVDEAFSQLVSDLDRTQAHIELTLPGGRSWQASDAIRTSDHPLRPLALADLRRHIEELCGPNASESMKANVFLAMSQNGMGVDGMLRPLFGLGTGGTKCYTYELSQDGQGNVVLNRSFTGHGRAIVLQSLTFHPDGTQELTEPPQFIVRDDQTLAQVQADVDNDQRAAIARANNQMESYVIETYAQPFAALFDSEIADLQAQYPQCTQAQSFYPKAPGNLLARYLAENHAEARRILSLAPDQVPQALADLKTKLLPRVRATMLHRAISEVCCAEAAEALRQAATVDGRAVDLTGVAVHTKGLQEKLSYLEFDDDHLDETSIRTAANAVRDKYIAGRLEVLNVIKSLSGEEAKLRDEYVRDALVYPRIGSAAYAMTLDIARNLPFPPVTAAKLTEADVKAALLAIGDKLRAAYAPLDPKEFGADQKGNMSTMIVTYLTRMRRGDILNLFGRLEAGAATRILHELEPDYSRASFQGDTAEYRDFKVRDNVQTIFQPILDQFDLD